jgi:hypothetical protein
MGSEEMPSYYFLDANVLMHFQTFDEVDWISVLGEREIELLLAPSVMREIDKFKDDSSNDWRKKRVRSLLNKLRTIWSGSTNIVRNNVSISDIDTEPTVDWEGLILDSAQPDDRLIASILEFKNKNPGSSIRLITNDFPLERKAKRHKIEVHNAETILNPIERVSDKDKVIRELEKRLQVVEARAPKLDVGLWESDSVVPFARVPRGAMRLGRPTDETIENAIDRLRSQIEQEVRLAEGAISDRSISKYQNEAAHHLINTRAALIKYRAREHDWRIELSFAIENRGSSATEDVSLVVTFPSGSFVVSLEDEDNFYDGFEDVKISNIPKPEWKIPVEQRMLVATLPGYEPWSRTYPEHNSQGEVPAGPFYFNDRSKVEFLHPKLRQTKRWVMDRIALYLPPTTDHALFINYELQAEGLATPMVGKFTVRFEDPVESV